MTVIAVKVVPGAAKDEIVGWLAGALKVRVQAPPRDGRANRALEALLAEKLGLKKNAVTVAAGHGSARKRVAVAGLTQEEIERRLAGNERCRSFRGEIWLRGRGRGGSRRSSRDREAGRYRREFPARHCHDRDAEGEIFLASRDCAGTLATP